MVGGRLDGGWRLDGRWEVGWSVGGWMVGGRLDGGWFWVKFWISVFEIKKYFIPLHADNEKEVIYNDYRTRKRR